LARACTRQKCGLSFFKTTIQAFKNPSASLLHPIHIELNFVGNYEERKMRIAFLGLGNMGIPIARHLVQAGHELTVWNRTRERAEPLAALGASIATSPTDAVTNAEIIFTMVMNDAALRAVLFDQGVLQAMPAGAIHVALSTISVALSDELTAEHRARKQEYLGSPVFGRPNVAEDGKLWTAVAGNAQAVEKVKPLLESFSRGVTVVSEKPSSAHALKLGGNFLITAMIAALSESMIFAEATGISPALFAETVNNAMFRSPFYESYAKIMLHPPEHPGGTVTIGEKDMRLFREAAQKASIKTPLGDLYYAHLERAINAGMKDADWAAGYYQLAKSTNREDD
jgi:3-hydroxyisobutyrate dehydrogenase-like beta-hydroxyacid dehydrogenase